MPTAYIALQSLAVALMAVNCWFPALLLAGVALLLALRGSLTRWLTREERSAREGTPLHGQA